METYDQLLNPQPARSPASKVTKGVIGLAAITAVGWVWKRIAARDREPAESATSTSATKRGTVHEQ